MSFRKLMLAAILIISMVLPLNVVLASVDDNPGTVTSVPREMSYQGILRDSGGDPVTDSVYSLTFRIFDVESGGSSLWEETLPCTTTAGVFNTMFSNVNLAFDVDYWLELEINSEIMGPRQKMGMVGYAAVADTSDAALDIVDDAITSAKIQNGAIQFMDIGQNGAGSGQVIKWNGSAWTAANDNIGSGNGWVDDGSVVRLLNDQDSVGIGTSDPSVKLHVLGDLSVGSGHVDSAFYSDGFNILVGQNHTTFGDYNSITGGTYNQTIWGAGNHIGSGTRNSIFYNNNVIGGGSDNKDSSDFCFIGGGQFNKAFGAYSAVGGGGGFSYWDGNLAFGELSFIGGGRSNRVYGSLGTIGGGISNLIDSTIELGTISGGGYNQVNATGGFVGGGGSNRADSVFAVVCGGSNNVAGEFGTIGGGEDNEASGSYSAIPGGYINIARGDYSFAAGYQAWALNDASFVWADVTGGSFQSTANNQFLIRASGGVGIGTNNPTAALHVNGEAKSEVGGVEFYMVPQGAIIMWSGPLANIPSGWALCDGTNGTPNLSDKFIYSVHAGEDPGATGGNATIPAHSHTVTHDHPATATGNNSNYQTVLELGGWQVARNPHTHILDLESITVNTNIQPATSIIPPYYKLAFIMKL